MWEPDDQTLSMLLGMIYGSAFFGGAFAGIATLIVTRKSNFFIEILRLLIGFIGGYEGILILQIFLKKDSFKNPNKILKLIIDFHYGILQIIFTFLILGILGAIGASIAIFIMREGISLAFINS